MNVEILTTYPPGSPEWLAQRQYRVGGSEVAAILGLSPWESPFSLWHRKAGNVPPPDMSDNEPVYWGNQLEDVVRREFVKRHRDTHYTRVETGVVIADGHLLASPDAVVSRKVRGSHFSANREVLEIKTARSGDEWGEAGTDQIPVHYRCQVQWYMGILALPVAHVAVLIAGSEYREYTVAHDQDDFDLMRDAADRFITSLRDGIAPPIDAAFATHDTLRKLHPEINRGDHAELPADLADELLATKAAYDEINDAFRLAKSRTLAAMGTAQHADHPDGHRVAYRMARGDADPFLVIDKQALRNHNIPERAAS